MCGCVCVLKFWILIIFVSCLGALGNHPLLLVGHWAECGYFRTGFWWVESTGFTSHLPHTWNGMLLLTLFTWHTSISKISASVSALDLIMTEHLCCFISNPLPPPPLHLPGHLESKSSIKRVLAITAVLSLGYSITQVKTPVCGKMVFYVQWCLLSSREHWRSCTQTVTCLQKTSTFMVTEDDIFGWPAPVSSSWSVVCIHVPLSFIWWLTLTFKLFFW